MRRADNPKRESTHGPARQRAAQNRSATNQQKQQQYFLCGNPARSHQGSHSSRHEFHRKNESAARLLSRRQFIESVELDNGHIFLIFDSGLHFGIRVLVFKTSATYLARGSERSPRGIMVKNSAKPTLKAQMPPHASRGRPNNEPSEKICSVAPVSRLICSMIWELKNSGFSSSRTRQTFSQQALQLQKLGLFLLNRRVLVFEGSQLLTAEHAVQPGGEFFLKGFHTRLAAGSVVFSGRKIIATSRCQGNNSEFPQFHCIASLRFPSSR